MHKDEERVHEISLLQKRSEKCIRLLQVLSSEGDFQHNIAAMKAGKDRLVVGRRVACRHKCIRLHCVHVLQKMTQKRSLWRHTHIVVSLALAT